MRLLGKNVVIYGAGVSGLSAYELARERGANVAIYDDDPSKARATSSVGVFDSADVIVLSPGVDSCKDFLVDAELSGKIVMSELELASSLCKAEQIAITGTNGKTTTTMLVDAIFKRAGLPSHAVGNIGTPFSAIADRLDTTEIAVIEASSFQLESSKNFSPEIAVLLNITPDHIDRHGSFEKYVEAKSNIFLRQSPSDAVIFNADDPAIAALQPQMIAKKVPFGLSGPKKGGAYISGGFVCFDGVPVLAVEETDMRGKELENVLAAVAVAALRGVSFFNIAAGIAEFERPDFRRQFVGKSGDISVFNDSKATNISSCISACLGMDGDVVLILGGALRAECFGQLFAALPASVRHICVSGENADAILSAANEADFRDIERYDDIGSALLGALDMAKKLGCKNVLFSPASKSFDLFSGYNERGKFFDACAKAAGVKRG